MTDAVNALSSLCVSIFTQLMFVLPLLRLLMCTYGCTTVCGVDMLLDNEADGETLLALTEQMIGKLLPIIRLPVQLLSLLSELYCPCPLVTPTSPEEAVAAAEPTNR